MLEEASTIEKLDTSIFYFDLELNDLYQELGDLSKKIESIKNNYFKHLKLDSRCPRQLSHFPEKPCELALNAIYEQPNVPKCDWHVLDSYSNYCFFVYSKLFLNGSHTLEEISELLVSTLSLTNLYFRNSLRKVRKKFISRGIRENFFSESD